VYQPTQKHATKKETAPSATFTSRTLSAGIYPHLKPKIGSPDTASAKGGMMISRREILCVLGCAGYGRLRPEGVRRELERMTTESVDEE